MNLTENNFVREWDVKKVIHMDALNILGMPLKQSTWVQIPVQLLLFLWF